MSTPNNEFDYDPLDDGGFLEHCADYGYATELLLSGEGYSRSLARYIALTDNWNDCADKFSRLEAAIMRLGFFKAFYDEYRTHQTDAGIEQQMFRLEMELRQAFPWHDWK